MPLVAVTGAVGAGGAIFAASDASPANPVIAGCKCVKVGDTAICPGHIIPIPSTIISGSSNFFVNGTPVAIVGSPTSCGHPLIHAGPNATVQAL